MTADPLMLDPAATALVLIDLQQGILGNARAPHDAATVLDNAARLVEAARRAGVPVVRVKVGWSADGRDRVASPVDTPAPAGPAAADWLDDPPTLPTRTGDLTVIKRQWGAFYGTELDLQLRRRGISTVVLGGITTSIGVESTARDAYERGYALVLAEDACGSPTAQAHGHSFTVIFPRIARVRTTAAIVAALDSGTRRA